jgi:hypothetical protein
VAPKCGTEVRQNRTECGFYSCRRYSKIRGACGTGPNPRGMVSDAQIREVCAKIAKVNEAVEAVGKEFEKKRNRKKKAPEAPSDLAEQLRELLDIHPELPWDKALVRIAQNKAKS